MGKKFGAILAVVVLGVLALAAFLRPEARSVGDQLTAGSTNTAFANTVNTHGAALAHVQSGVSWLYVGLVLVVVALSVFLLLAALRIKELEGKIDSTAEMVAYDQRDIRVIAQVVGALLEERVPGPTPFPIPKDVKDQLESLLPKKQDDAGSGGDLVSQLDKLAVLHMQGELNDEQYERAKAKMLGIPPVPPKPAGV